MKKSEVRKGFASRKFLFVVLIAGVLVVLFGSIFVMSQGTPPERVSERGGDANGDGIIDISDATYVLRFLFQGGEAPARTVTEVLKEQAELGNVRADVNGDGIIDADDVYAAFGVDGDGPAEQEEPSEPLRCDSVEDATTSGLGESSWDKKINTISNPTDEYLQEVYNSIKAGVFDKKCEETEIPESELTRMRKEASDKAISKCKENAVPPNCAFPCNSLIRSLKCELSKKMELTISVYGQYIINPLSDSQYEIYCRFSLTREAKGTYQKVCEAEG